MLGRIATAEARAAARYGAWESYGPLVSVYASANLPINVIWHDGTRPPTVQEWLAAEAFLQLGDQRPEVQVMSHAVNGLLPALTERGYQLRYALNAYTHDLKDLPPLPQADLRQSHDPEDWASVAARGFDCAPELMQAVARAKGTDLFIIWLGGRIAGTAALSIEGDLAALHGTATLPEFRGLGVQTAFLAYRLAFAKLRQTKLTTVFVSPQSASERNVRRAGFELAGMRLTFTKAK